LNPARKPVLCYVTDRRALELRESAQAATAVVEIAARAAAAKVDWIELREKDLTGRALFDLAVRTVARCASTRLLVNDRLDVALTAGAHGVHLTAEGLPVDAVRTWAQVHAGREFLIGKSCHSLDEARTAERDGADYIFFGPIFATPSKLAYGPPQGTGRLGEVCRAIEIPAIAIGGITPENAGQCISAGASGVAAIRWFQEPGDLAMRVAALRQAISP
jgi:thiamine-phosphate pyrophosphorylase